MFSRKAAAAALFVVLTASPAAAQFTPTSLELGPTIGLGGTGTGGGISIGGRVEKGIKTLPSLNNGILSIAGFVQRYTYDVCGIGDCGASVIFLGATANYHFVIKTSPKWDPFIGLGLGYSRVSIDNDNGFDYDASSGIEFVGNAGVRYYFSPKMSGYVDLGAGAATVNIGIMFKLK